MCESSKSNESTRVFGFGDGHMSLLKNVGLGNNGIGGLQTSSGQGVFVGGWYFEG